jgi:hypothetical protein
MRSVVDAERSFEKSQDTVLSVISWRPWGSARNKPDMASTFVKFHAQATVPTCYSLHLAKHRRRQKRVVVRAQQQCGPADR